MEDVLIGDHIGAYRVTASARLGAGAYAAVHRHTGRKVHVLVAPSRDLVEYVRTIQALPHPGIPRVIDRGALPDHRPWLAIDLPSGLPLFELIARRPMPSAEVTSLVHAVAGVLAFAHERGIAHGGLGVPSIVMTTGQRSYPISITDFARSEGGEPAADLLALGTIAYRAVTQRFPTAIIDGVPNAEPALADLIARMLAHDPDERPTAHQVRIAAAQLIDLEPLDAEDRAHPNGRFAAPKWTPAPPLGTPITSDSAPSVAGEITGKPPKA